MVEQSREFSVRVPDDHLIERGARGVLLIEQGDAVVECVQSLFDRGEITVIAIASKEGSNSSEYIIRGSNLPAFSKRHSYHALSGALFAIASSLGRREKRRLRSVLVNLKHGEEMTIGRIEGNEST